jgi:hypothetical protein
MSSTLMEISLHLEWNLPLQADYGRCSIASLFDDLISAGEQRVRHVYPQRLSRLEVDDQFKFPG